MRATLPKLFAVVAGLGLTVWLGIAIFVGVLQGSGRGLPEDVAWTLAAIGLMSLFAVALFGGLAAVLFGFQGLRGKSALRLGLALVGVVCLLAGLIILGGRGPLGLPLLMLGMLALVAFWRKGNRSEA